MDMFLYSQLVALGQFTHTANYSRTFETIIVKNSACGRLDCFEGIIALVDKDQETLDSILHWIDYGELIVLSSITITINMGLTGEVAITLIKLLTKRTITTKCLGFSLGKQGFRPWSKRRSRVVDHTCLTNPTTSIIQALGLDPSFLLKIYNSEEHCIWIFLEYL